MGIRPAKPERIDRGDRWQIPLPGERFECGSIDGGLLADTLEVTDGGTGGGVFTLNPNGLGAILQRTDAFTFTLDIQNTEIFTFTGETGDDLFTVGDLTNSLLRDFTFNGGGGDDTLNGAGNSFDMTANGDAGDDTLIGGQGIDTLNGGGDDDTLIGQAGDDTLDGGAGTDTADYSDSPGGITVSFTDFTIDDGFGGSDTIVSVSSVSTGGVDESSWFSLMARTSFEKGLMNAHRDRRPASRAS